MLLRPWNEIFGSKFVLRFYNLEINVNVKQNTLTVTNLSNVQSDKTNFSEVILPSSFREKIQASFTSTDISTYTQSKSEEKNVSQLPTINHRCRRIQLISCSFSVVR